MEHFYKIWSSKLLIREWYCTEANTSAHWVCTDKKRPIYTNPILISVLLSSPHSHQFLPESHICQRQFTWPINLPTGGKKPEHLMEIHTVTEWMYKSDTDRTRGWAHPWATLWCQFIEQVLKREDKSPSDEHWFHLTTLSSFYTFEHALQDFRIVHLLANVTEKAIPCS